MQNIGYGFAKSTGERKSQPAPEQDNPPDHSGVTAAFNSFGVSIAKFPRTFSPDLAMIHENDRKSSARALGGAVGWSIHPQADAKSTPIDRRLLSRLCEVARQSESPHEAIWAVQRALPPLPGSASSLQRLTRLEVLREGGRAITREFPKAVVTIPASLAFCIARAGSPPEVAAMSHGITLELRHQGLVMPKGNFWWRDLGDGINIPVAAGAQITQRLSEVNIPYDTLRTMPLEQALLYLSSLRYHVQASDRDIDELANEIRRRPDVSSEVEEVIDAMVPVPGAMAAHQLKLEARHRSGTREDLERLVVASLRENARRITHLFTVAADVFVRPHAYQAGHDEITEADFLTVKGLEAFEAFERALNFYDSYHKHSLSPLLAQARQTPRPAHLQRTLEHHAQVLRQELLDLESRPYIREALGPFGRRRAAPVEALRNRIRHPLSLIDTVLGTQAGVETQSGPAAVT